MRKGVFLPALSTRCERREGGTSGNSGTLAGTSRKRPAGQPASELHGLVEGDAPAKLGYLYGESAARDSFVHLAERAWLALPGTPDGKAQAYPQSGATERWLSFVYRQLEEAPSSDLSADDMLWTADVDEGGEIIEKQFPAQAVEVLSNLVDEQLH